MRIRNTTHLGLLSTVSRIVIGGIFLVAAISKIGDLQGFHKALAAFSFLPQWIVGLATLLVPGFELTIGGCLLTRVALRECALLAMSLLLVFIGFGTYLAITKSTSNCHCFTFQVPVWFAIKGWWIVGRNVLFLCLAVFIDLPLENR